jgi:hypothetical protein
MPKFWAIAGVPAVVVGTVKVMVLIKPDVAVVKL